ncbi:MAG: hypothetical protein F6J90_37450 [Moorea sp. SIOASIH]|uniref:hypothetical protein n=1 Tax=Moorena sp. SIOASIH TaxID=2607817 RepID=UPI0013B89CAC|nr:hypothetical protein [Moorena sp. SIOASIH]NEO38656.1 hypothetical protein [Moorena sp. SIOASIH]NEO38682.1 hypothetical protein [Moorena sp. SIOASIH]NEO41706.1 hypothetical protein [Moorena sp. SIOASIH]
MTRGIREVRPQKILTVLRMMVKTHPLRKQVTPYLGHTEQAATSQSEAGTRAELEVKQISHTTAL